MAEKKDYKKEIKRAAAARVIPVLLLCVFVLSGLMYFTADREEQPAEPVTPEDIVTSDEAASAEEPELPLPPTTEEMLAAYIETMTLEEKVGQMFLIRCPDEDAAEKIERYQPGGVILFARDFKDRSPEQVQANIASYQDASKVPLLTAVDEEGGDVNRISWYTQYRSTPFAGPQKLYKEGGFARIESDTVEKCQLLTSLGINVNMAPVCDISENPSAYIYKRTFGQDAVATSRYIRQVVRTMNQQNVGSVLKHFPGYGGNSDTHQGFSVDTRPYSQFLASDLRPFQAGIQAGAGCVLVSHNIVECMDDEKPASLSREVHRVLREELGFDGVIMTDDLVMEAITDAYGTAEAAVLAVKAGNDMLCCSDYKTQIPAVIAAAESGKISEAQINESVLRVLLWKHALGLVETGPEEEETK